MLRKDPNFQFVGSTTEYKPVEGVKMVVEGPNGLYFPIVPLEDSAYHTVYTLDWQVVPFEEIEQHLAKPSGYLPPKIPMLIDKIAGISAGGAFLKNAEFKYLYLGDNSQKFQ